MSIPAPDERRIRVVLADDTEDVRLLLRIALGRDGRFDIVGEATNGLEAVAAVAEAKPDVILLDLAMPVMDGMQAIPEIRSVAPQTEIVVLSGFEKGGLEEEALRLGARTYIEKGMPLDEMMATIEAIVGPGVHAERTPEEPSRPADDMHDLLSMLGHELSSPVAVIEGFATMIKREASRLSKDEVVEFADAIARGGRQLQVLINSFYDARHLAAGEFVIEPRETDIGGLLEQTLHDLLPAVESHPLRSAIDVRSTVHADPVRIRQVVENLVINAAKFSPPREPIDVQARAVGTSVEIAVVDLCGGIAPEDKPKLFHRFSKIRKGGPGLGLGLYISRGIATAHGGELSYEPHEGGCIFRLTLPA